MSRVAEISFKGAQDKSLPNYILTKTKVCRIRDLCAKNTLLYFPPFISSLDYEHRKSLIGVHRQPVNCCIYPNKTASWINCRHFLFSLFLIPNQSFLHLLSCFFLSPDPMLQQVQLVDISLDFHYWNATETIYKSKLINMGSCVLGNAN